MGRSTWRPFGSELTAEGLSTGLPARSKAGLPVGLHINFICKLLYHRVGVTTPFGLHLLRLDPVWTHDRNILSGIWRSSRTTLPFYEGLSAVSLADLPAVFLADLPAVLFIRRLCGGMAGLNLYSQI